MSDVIIRAEGLSKRYFLKHKANSAESYTLLRDAFGRALKGIGLTALDKMRGGPTDATDSMEEFWALNNVSFEIRRGDIVGVIGRNGAGKSTLLKILSRITEPTKGRVEINGRLASLLEVGTGFHPELTGRENIYLNGAILGMSRAEIRAKFDEIVDFAEVEKFLDTPVKRYSSGMYVRLAFAVAAHLEPEILVIDEVLAVGDAEFQKKCLGKMQDVAGLGRTVLFVSHNLAMVRSLCQRGILLENGSIRTQSSISDAIATYASSDGKSAASINFEEIDAPVGSKCAHLLSACVRNEHGIKISEAEINRGFTVEMTYRLFLDDGRIYYPNFHFFASDGRCAFVTSAAKAIPMPPGVYVSRCQIPANLLNDGMYAVRLALSTFENGIEVHFDEYGALSFNINDPISGVPTRTKYTGLIPGVMRPDLSWTIDSVPDANT